VRGNTLSFIVATNNFELTVAVAAARGVNSSAAFASTIRPMAKRRRGSG
jgi:ACR3 family arsenite efflux pump ArsB